MLRVPSMLAGTSLADSPDDTEVSNCKLTVVDIDLDFASYNRLGLNTCSCRSLRVWSRYQAMTRMFRLQTFPL